LALLSEMCEAKLVPNAIASGNSVASTCERDGQRSEVLSLLREIGDAKLETDDVSHNGCIRACEEGGPWLEALSLAMKIGEVMLETEVIGYTAGLGACEKGVISYVRYWCQRVCEGRAEARGAVAAREGGGKRSWSHASPSIVLASALWGNTGGRA